ncbi:MAG: hypothetical protein HY553_18775 [Elusimicrobia bacterium]|nr:hypothetical protein [Elusimicrobiota bacterium]
MLPALPEPRGDRRRRLLLALGGLGLLAVGWALGRGSLPEPARALLASALPGVGRAEIRAPKAARSLMEPFAPQGGDTAWNAGPSALTFERLKSLLATNRRGAAEQFVQRAAPAANPDAPGSEPALEARHPPRFATYLDRLARNGPAATVARGLLREPETTEALREALLERERALAPASRVLVRPGAAAAGAPPADPARQALAGRTGEPPSGFRAQTASARGFSAVEAGSAAGRRDRASAEGGSGASPHGVDPRLAALNASGPGKDARKFLESMFASFPKSSRDKLLDACENKGICDFVQACITAQVYDECLSACRANPLCSIPPPPAAPGPTPAAPGPAEPGGCGGSIPDNSRAPGPAAAGKGKVCVNSNSSRAYFVVGPAQSWGWNNSHCWDGHPAGVYSVNTNGSYGYPAEQQAMISPSAQTLSDGGTITFNVSFCTPEIGD